MVAVVAMLAGVDQSQLCLQPRQREARRGGRIHEQARNQRGDQGRQDPLVRVHPAWCCHQTRQSASLWVSDRCSTENLVEQVFDTGMLRS